MKSKVFECHLRIGHDHSKCTEGIIEELLIDFLFDKANTKQSAAS
jgi:hypothetical protein